jgi:hypothetical protein
MKTSRPTLLLSSLALALLLTVSPRQARADVTIDFDTYAAVAYSRSTGKYGSAWNYGSRSAAQRAALARCPAADARIVAWVKGGWVALAIGENNAYGYGYSYGVGSTNGEAKRRASAECLQRTKRVTTVICLCSGDYPPEVRSAD